MFNSEALEVGVGMAFLFLLMSIICTAIREWLEGILRWRAMDLEQGIRTLLDDPKGRIAQQLFAHPAIGALFRGTYDPAGIKDNAKEVAGEMRWRHRRNLPSYIPTGQFATALLDWAVRGSHAQGDAQATSTVTIASLRDAVDTLPKGHAQEAIRSALDYAQGDLSRARQSIERWFDGTMDRVSGWYKRRTQALLFTIGLVTAVVINVDALFVMHRLINDKSLRDAVVADAGSAKSSSNEDKASERIAQSRSTLAQLGMPIGWASCKDGDPWPSPKQLCPGAFAVEKTRPYDVFMVAVGWLVTAFAIMLGAPFWFDVLDKFMVVRSTVKPREKSPEEASKGGSTEKVEADATAPPPAGKP